MALRKAFVLLGIFIQSALSQLPPWDNQLFDFGWEPYNPTATRCSTINVGWNDRSTANPASTPPYTLFAISGGNAPLVVGTTSTKTYNWKVGLPAGGPYIMSMKDANGYTGGNSLVLNINEATSGSCDTTAFTANPFQLTSSGSFAECSVATVTAQGGQGPYTMQVFVGERPPKTTTWTTTTMSYTVDLNVGEQFFFVVTDAAGNTAVDGIHTVGSGDASCYNVATTVRVGAVGTTLSYVSGSTATYPTASDTSSTRVIQNTDTTTVTSVVTLANGHTTTYAIPPGSTVTLADTSGSTGGTSNNSNSSSKVLPAAIGGAVGGAALVLLGVLFFYLYRQSQNRKKSRTASSGGHGGHGGIGPSPTIPYAATQIQPYPPSANPEHAPLMHHPYAAGTPASTHTSYFNPAPITTNYQGYNQNQPVPWADNRMSHLTYTSQSQPGMYSPPTTGTSQGFNPVQPASPPMTITSLNRQNDLPPGAMAPAPARSASFSASVAGSSPSMQPTSMSTSEKASYVPPGAPPTPAPPPYSH